MMRFANFTSPVMYLGGFGVAIVSLFAQQRFFLRLAFLLCAFGFTRPLSLQPVVSAGNTTKNRVVYIDVGFEQALLAAKIDFILEKMMAASTAPDVTLFDSQRFFHSGKFFAAHYSDLSAQQKNKFMQCITT